MRRKILNCCLFGAPAGLTLQVMLTVLLSYLRGDGAYNRVSYYLLQIYGNELNAMTAQYLSAMVIGMIWSTASLIYRETDWSLLKQMVIHFLVCVTPSLVIAYIMRWMIPTLDGFLGHLGWFLAIYLAIWAVQYNRVKKRIVQMNAKLNSGDV